MKAYVVMKLSSQKGGELEEPFAVMSDGGLTALAKDPKTLGRELRTKLGFDTPRTLENFTLSFNPPYDVLSIEKQFYTVATLNPLQIDEVRKGLNDIEY